MTTLPPLRIGKHIALYPIIQGGMGIRISGANLASAVANAGGIVSVLFRQFAWDSILLIKKPIVLSRL